MTIRPKDLVLVGVVALIGYVIWSTGKQPQPAPDDPAPAPVVGPSEFLRNQAMPLIQFHNDHPRTTKKLADLYDQMAVAVARTSQVKNLKQFQDAHRAILLEFLAQSDVHPIGVGETIDKILIRGITGDAQATEIPPLALDGTTQPKLIASLKVIAWGLRGGK